MINITSAIALGISCSGFSFRISSVHYNSGSASGRGSPWSSRASNVGRSTLLVIRGRGGGVPVISSSGASDATRACVAVSYYNIKLLLQISLSPQPQKGKELHCHIKAICIERISLGHFKFRCAVKQ